jgi:hypothetical protein
MRDSSIRATGAVVLFKATDDMSIIGCDMAFASIGMGHLSPSPRTKLAILKVALTHLTGLRAGQRLVRLEDAHGYAVVQASATVDGKASAEVLMSAYLHETPAGLVARVSDPNRREAFAECLRKAKSEVDGTAVSVCVTEAITALGGVALRESGGVYWIPEGSVEQWKTLGAGLEAASAGRGARAYTIRTQGDPDSVRACVDAFVREADALVQEVEDELKTGLGGHRAATNRAARMADLSALAERYESTLGVGLAAIRERIDRVQGDAAHTALLALDNL